MPVYYQLLFVLNSSKWLISFSTQGGTLPFTYKTGPNRRFGNRWKSFLSRLALELTCISLGLFEAFCFDKDQVLDLSIEIGLDFLQACNIAPVCSEHVTIFVVFLIGIFKMRFVIA